MLKTTMLFIGLLTEVSHLNPDLSMTDLKQVASHMREEPEFRDNIEIVEFINIEMSSTKTAMRHCQKAAMNIGLRPREV